MFLNIDLYNLEQCLRPNLDMFLLINSLIPVDSTSDLLSYYFATILHLGALSKSQQGSCFI